jgi:voltage-gated potassium channel Kch
MISIKLFQEEKVTLETIQGALCTYLMGVIVWGMLYRIVHLLNSKAFITPSQNNYPSYFYMYFSFTTITTTGYGDIVPIDPIAMGLANLEAFFGIMFPAILIARLVSLYQRK